MPRSLAQESGWQGELKEEQEAHLDVVLEVQQRLHGSGVENTVKGVHKRLPVVVGSAQEVWVDGPIQQRIQQRLTGKFQGSCTIITILPFICV